jgi:O-antigen/teichoic acid export membrane protein
MRRYVSNLCARHAAPLAEILGSSLVSRFGSVGLATLVSKLLTLGSLGVAARALGPEAWGLAGSALAAVAYASVLLSPGLMAWGTREIARDRECTRAALVIVNLTQAALALIAFGAIAAAGWRFIEAPAVRAVWLISALALFAQALSVEWVFDGLERPQVQARLQIVVSAARLGAVVWLCHSPADIFAYAAILPFFLGIQALAGYWVLYRGGWFRPLWPGLASTRRALAAAWPLGVTMALFLLAHNANTLIVQAVHGWQAAGHYLAALRLVEMASVLPGVLGTVFRPRLARVCSSGSPAAARETQLYARAHLLAGWLLASLVFAEAPRIIGWLYGESYAAAAPLLRIFALAILANYLVCGYTNCLVAFGCDRVVLRAMAIAGPAAVGAGLALTPVWGPPGAALAASLIHPLGWLLALPEYRRTVGSLEWRHWTRPCAAALAIVALSWWLEGQGVGTAGRMSGSAAIYLVIAGRCWSELEHDTSGAVAQARDARAWWRKLSACSVESRLDAR